MSYDYINGVSYPRITVFSLTDNTVVEQIDLPLCNTAGLVEDYQEDFKRNQTEAGRIINFDNKACRIKFTLDYSEYLRKAETLVIEKVFFYNSQPDKFKIILTPRVDVLKRFFEVCLDDGAYSMGVNKGGTNARGNRLAIIKFITKYTVGKNFVDPADVLIPLPFKVRI